MRIRTFVAKTLQRATLLQTTCSMEYLLFYSSFRSHEDIDSGNIYFCQETASPSIFQKESDDEIHSEIMR